MPRSQTGRDGVDECRTAPHLGVDGIEVALKRIRGKALAVQMNLWGWAFAVRVLSVRLVK